MGSLAIAAENPFRPPDWMWLRATEVVNGEGRRPSRQRDGLKGFKWINRAIRFIRAYRQCDTEQRKADLAHRSPEIFWAYWCWSSTTNVQKHLIEAHLLARSDFYSIGRRCGMTPGMIEAYEALFFNVREKLEHRSYILNCVMGPAIHRGLSEREHDLLWKLYGYFLGPYIVDALESRFANPVWCSTPEGVGAAVLDDAIGTLKLKAALAAKTVPVNQSTQMALMDQFTRFVEIERTTDSAGKAQAQVLEHIAAMMTTLPFAVGRPRGQAEVFEFEDTAAELNYAETMFVSTGQPLDNAEELKRLSFSAATESAEGSS